MPPAIVGILSNQRLVDGVPLDTLRMRYAQSLRDIAGVIPIIISTLDLQGNEHLLLRRIDGLVLSGDESNIDPVLYGHESVSDTNNFDRSRDSIALRLLKLAAQTGLPTLGICRGIQEINVAYGGTLHQKLDPASDFANHKEDLRLPRDQQYWPTHRVDIVNKHGILLSIIKRDSFFVNSLHEQGIATLGANLVAEAVAPDGLIEAVSLRHAPGFFLGVQWHPEWHASSEECSRAIIEYFGNKCREYAAARHYRSLAESLFAHL
jgi:putative glutamine amidotransferase